jgi:hypothetical protein
MRKRVACAVVLVLVALGGIGVSQGVGAATPSAAPVQAERPVPAAGARLTTSQVREVRQIALEDAAEHGEDAPTLMIAGTTQRSRKGRR